MPSGERGIANTFRWKQLVVAGDDYAIRGKRIGRIVIGITRRVEIVNAAVFFSEAAVPVEAQPGSQAEIGAKLKLVLEISAGLTGTHVTVRIALKELGSREIVIDGHQALEELAEVRGRDDSLIRSLVTCVELGVGVASAESDGVLALRPDGVGGRHDPILKYPGKRRLGSCTLPDVEKVVGHGGFPSENVHDADSGEIGRTEGVDVQLLRSERLSDGAVNFFAKNAENLDDAQIGPQGLRIGEGSHLTASIKVLGESGKVRVGVRSESGIKLIIVFGREGVFGTLVPVKIRHHLVG